MKSVLVTVVKSSRSVVGSEMHPKERQLYKLVDAINDCSEFNSFIKYHSRHLLNIVNKALDKKTYLDEDEKVKGTQNDIS